MEKEEVIIYNVDQKVFLIVSGAGDRNTSNEIYTYHQDKFKINNFFDGVYLLQFMKEWHIKRGYDAFIYVTRQLRFFDWIKCSVLCYITARYYKVLGVDYYGHVKGGT